MDAAGTSAHTSEVEAQLFDDFVHGAVDYNGRPILRSKSGCWRSAYFIICVEVAERLAYYGVSSNLITYLTGPLGQSTATAAENVNAWSGTASLLPLLCAFIADAFLGRYRTIIVASLLYILALGLLTVSALLTSSDCESATEATTCSSPQLQVILFFVSLYLMAFAQGGHKPCVQAFGADQFDSDNPKECKEKSSFFNWWYLGMCVGPMVALLGLNYIQDNLNWGLGFGIPCILMGVALLIFLLGNKTYRFGDKSVDDKSALVRIGRVFVTACRNWRTAPSAISMEEEACGTLSHQGSHQFRFLNKALVLPEGSKEDGKVCSISEIEDAKRVLRLIPIWASCLVYAVVFAQFSTLFTKQGVTLDRSIGSFTVPPASLQSFVGLSIVSLIPFYDLVLVPLARAVTRKPSGITMLQRIGTGIFLSIVSMVISALVEIKRLETAFKYGLVDKPDETVPMTMWWLVPQYLLIGAADVFTVVGLQEFFYDQVPSDLRSVGLALYLSIFGVGNFLSSFLIAIVDKTTGGNDQDGWIADNLNQGHLDYFFWLLAGISAAAFVIYLYVAKAYIYIIRDAVV